MDLVAFLLPIPTVTGNLTQLTFQIDMIRTNLLRSRADNLFRQTDFASNFDGKRTARLAGLQPKERTNILYVKGHGTV